MESVRLVGVMMEYAATRCSREVMGEAMMAFLWWAPLSERLMEMVRLMRRWGAGNGEVRRRFFDLLDVHREDDRAWRLLWELYDGVGFASR
jgi:hypothetical protein